MVNCELAPQPIRVEDSKTSLLHLLGDAASSALSLVHEQYEALKENEALKRTLDSISKVCDPPSCRYFAFHAHIYEYGLQLNVMTTRKNVLVKTPKATLYLSTLDLGFGNFSNEFALLN